MSLFGRVKEFLGLKKAEKLSKFHIFVAGAIGALVFLSGIFLLAGSSAQNLETVDVSLSATYFRGEVEGIKVSWDESKVNGQLSLQRKKDDGSYLEIGPIPADKSTVYDTSIKGETTYYYRVKIVSGGSEIFSEPVEVNTPKLSGPLTQENVVSSSNVPESPSNLAAQYVSGISNPYIKLTWKDESTNETGFVVERSVGSIDSFIQVGSVGPNVLVFSDKTIKENTEYFYRLRAINNNLSSGYSNIFSLKTTPPVVVNNNTAVNLNVNTNINVNVNTNSAPGEEQPTTTPTSTTETLPPAESIQEPTSTATTVVPIVTPIVKPDAPSNLSAKYTNKSVFLDWLDMSDDENGFVIQRRDKVGIFSWSDYISISVVPANQNYFSDAEIFGDKTYQYRVLSFNQYGESEPSNAATVDIPSLVPLAPSNLKAAHQKGVVNLAWKDNSDDENGFVISRRKKILLIFWESYGDIASVEKNQTTFTDTFLEPKATYEYRIKAVNYFGDSDFSNSNSVKIQK